MLRTMTRTVYTGFHVIEERIKRAASAGQKPSAADVLYAVPAGPRVKKILQAAREHGIPCREAPLAELDSLAKHLPFAAKDHRGVILVVETDSERPAESCPEAGLDSFIAASPPDALQTVLILDSITDPHNIGAIIRSAHQFGASLVIVPKNNTLKDIRENQVVARASAGTIARTPVAVTANLTRAAENLKDAGFWIYAADASGSPARQTQFAPKTALVLGSEGSGISRLLAEHCDARVSIPVCGTIDSLNVSVAAGILLYEAFMQRLCQSTASGLAS
jgi:23S rRNA (guanosine2251-2'-O)-methyltransferase